jgi:stage II sporulation protein AA (anti-sigma F factor antagonist)
MTMERRVATWPVGEALTQNEASLMEILPRKLANVCVIGIQGRLDSGTADSLAQYLQQAIHGGERRVVIDGETLDYISSAGLRVLLVAAKQLKPLNGHIVLSSLMPHIREVFEVAGFTSVFPVYGTVEQAAQGFPLD